MHQGFRLRKLDLAGKNPAMGQILYYTMPRSGYASALSPFRGIITVVVNAPGLRHQASSQAARNENLHSEDSVDESEEAIECET